MKSIGLCMIVKNESHVITRCLDSLKRIIDYVIIVDTGSTDNTIDVIKDWLINNQIKGEVISEGWQNFAYNRSFSLSKLREREDIDYALMIDADEILIFDEGFDDDKFKENLVCDIYDITTNMGGFIYSRPTLTSNKKFCKYDGVVHEFLVVDGGTRDTARGFYNYPIQDSDRNRSGNKFLKDTQLIEEALKGEISDWFRSRYTFYLAQSYRDSGFAELALTNYLARSEQGFWNEEIYLSLYYAANLMKFLGYPKEQIIQAYLKAHEVIPHRLEALHGAVNYCRINGLNQQGYMLGKFGINTPIPSNSLFLEKWIYDYALIDEFSIVAYWSNNFEDSRNACERLLLDKKIPEHYLDRVKSNLNFSLEKTS